MNIKVGVKSGVEESYTVEMNGLSFARYKDYTECSIQVYVSDLLTSPRPLSDTNTLLKLQGLTKYKSTREYRSKIYELVCELQSRLEPGDDEVYEDYYFLLREIRDAIETLEHLETF